VHVFGFAFDANGNASSTVYLTRIQANERVSDNIWGVPRERGISAGNDWSNDYQSLECDAVRASNIGSQALKRLATVIKPDGALHSSQFSFEAHTIKKAMKRLKNKKRV
jgi:hypothetical protein